MEFFLNLILRESNNSKYAKWYCNLITKCKYLHEGYTENHHIAPRCLFPNYTKLSDNKIRLSAREHFVAHLLLCKAFPNNRKLAFAFFAMTQQKSSNRNYRVHSRIYEIARKAALPLLIELGTFKKGYVVAKNTISNTVVTVTKDEFDMSIHLIGPSKGQTRNFTEEHKQAMRKPKNSHPPKTPAHKQKLAKAHKGKTHTNKTKEKLSNHFSKKWVIMFPDGHTETIINLKQFCKTYNISQGNIYKTINNPNKNAKGYKIHARG
jgi:hypothetical protein